MNLHLCEHYHHLPQCCLHSKTVSCFSSPKIIATIKNTMTHTMRIPCTFTKLGMFLHYTTHMCNSHLLVFSLSSLYLHAGKHRHATDLIGNTRKVACNTVEDILASWISMTSQVIAAVALCSLLSLESCRWVGYRSWELCDRKTFETCQQYQSKVTRSERRKHASHEEQRIDAMQGSHHPSSSLINITAFSVLFVRPCSLSCHEQTDI